MTNDADEQEKPEFGLFQFLESLDQKPDWSEMGYFSEFLDLVSQVDQKDIRVRMKW